MKLCECGCGKKVKDSVRFRPGHHNRCESVKQKKRETCLKNHGVTNPSKSKSIQQKKKDTCLRRYGVESSNQSDLVKEKKKQTSRSNYGVDNPNQSDSIKRKKIDTCIKNFGVEHPSQSEIVNDKKIQTYRKNYGVDHPMHNDEFKSELQNVFQEKYNVDNPSQILEVKQKKIETEKLHFGMPFCQTFEHRKKSRENLIQLHEQQRLKGDPPYPAIGLFERSCLDELEELSPYSIIRNSPMIGYYPDGFIQELDLVIEFDEEHHDWTYQKEIDDQKDLDYSHMNLNIHRIKKKDWLSNKEKCIKEFKLFCEEIANSKESDMKIKTCESVVW